MLPEAFEYQVLAGCSWPHWLALPWQLLWMSDVRILLRRAGSFQHSGYKELSYHNQF